MPAPAVTTVQQHTEQVLFEDLSRIDYQQAWDYQTTLHKKLVERKLAHRAGNDVVPLVHHLLFCEHNPVYTLGKSGSLDHLLLDEDTLQQQGFSFYKINRGGDITYHGPGQIVAYPIFDLDAFFTDVHRYVRLLEEAVILTLAEFDVQATRMPTYTGVWLEASGQQPHRKICAIGVHLSRWVTMHGLAFNINSNLAHFNHIIPCGIQAEDKTVTSLSQELGRTVLPDDVKPVLKKYFAELFGFTYLDNLTGIDSAF